MSLLPILVDCCLCPQPLLLPLLSLPPTAVAVTVVVFVVVVVVVIVVINVIIVVIVVVVFVVVVFVVFVVLVILFVVLVVIVVVFVVFIVVIVVVIFVVINKLLSPPPPCLHCQFQLIVVCAPPAITVATIVVAANCCRCHCLHRHHNRVDRHKERLCKVGLKVR